MTSLCRPSWTSMLAACVLSGALLCGQGVLAKDKEKKPATASSAVKAPAGPPLAEPPALTPAPVDGVAEPCIKTDFIRDTKVKDDQTIRFRMRGGATYEVKLRDRCFGLAFHESFYYQVSPTRQLCARYDTIIARSGSRCRIEQIIRLNRKPDEKKDKDKDAGKE